MVVKAATPGRYADVNRQLNAVQAKELADSGILGIARYIPREPALIAGNVTKPEVQAILEYLSLYFVQHCPLPNWSPNAALGQQWGAYAVTYLKSIGVPPLVSVFLDLEGVATSASDLDVIAYANAWWEQVNAGGYSPGIYIGFGTNLSNLQLYINLKFKSYWASYNTDQSVPTRGWQIKQRPQTTVAGITIDPDTISADLLGDLPMLLYNS
jgi:Domain of unknown function (DUF1906)